MLHAVRLKRTVSPDGVLTLQLPELRGLEVEAIIVPQCLLVPREALASALAQEQSGFAQQVLTDPAEDVWNEL